ncbi:MAG: tyrosine-protein phosphatase [Victivallales bacterium]|nr:tyrosine-protein phosphatase [Victivallales bacterium]
MHLPRLGGAAALCLSLVLLGALAWAEDTIAIKNPVDGAVVQNMKPTQRLYVELTEAEARRLTANPNVTRDWSSVVRSQPQGVTLRWHFQGERRKVTYRLTYAENSELKDAVVLAPPHSNHVLYNLKIGQTYHWKVEAVYQDGTGVATPVCKFTVDPHTPRVMNVPGMNNVRDLGGRAGLGGRMIPQGLIYRSAGFNFNSSDGGKTPGKPQFNAEGLRVIREVMKIRTDLDLRSAKETANMPESPVGPDINFVHIPATAYAGIFTPKGMANFAALFRVFCHRENYPIDFHCIGGADRTGSLAFLLLAVLGVAREELMRDYTFTSFFAVRVHTVYDVLERGMDKFGTPEEPLVQKAERYLLKAGVTAEEIAAFREIVLGPGLPMAQPRQEAAE